MYHHSLPSVVFRQVMMILLIVLLVFTTQCLVAAEAGSWAPMIKQVAPSVVTIGTTSTIHQRSAWPEFPGPPGMRDFFGQPPGGDGQRQLEGLGSGVIISADGYLLTNNHVIRGADTLKVTLANGDDSFTAKVVGTDEKCDLAVLKLDLGKTTLQPMVFADSSQVEVGDTVLAIGNPMGVGQTVTMGIISAIGRGVGLIDYEDFLQTDAAINPGNSGGALIDTQGHLVGINTAILSRTGGNMGIGFAIPANLAHAVMEQIIAHGKVVRGQLGVMIQAVTPELVTALKLARREGVLVSDVLPDGAAAKAGIRSGDVITAFDQAPINDPRTLRLRVAQVVVGRSVPVVIQRGKGEVKLNVVLQAQEERETATDDGKADKANPASTAIGIRVQELAAELRQRLNLPERVAGGLIAEVEPDSRAERAGLKAGDVIQAVDGNPTATAQAVRQALQGRADSVLLRVWGGGGSRFAVVPAAEK